MDDALDPILALFPVLALFLTSILFIHLGQRSKASLVSLLSITFLPIWMSSAHTVFHWFVENEHGKFIRMSNHSTHPVFDTVFVVFSFGLFALFLVSFFVASISISVTGASRPPPGFMARFTNGISTRALWLLTVALAVLSLVGMLCYRYFAGTEHHLEFAIPSAVIALTGLVFVVLLSAFAIRRHFIQSRTG